MLHSFATQTTLVPFFQTTPLIPRNVYILVYAHTTTISQASCKLSLGLFSSFLHRFSRYFRFKSSPIYLLYGSGFLFVCIHILTNDINTPGSFLSNSWIVQTEIGPPFSLILKVLVDPSCCSNFWDEIHVHFWYFRW